MVHLSMLQLLQLTFHSLQPPRRVREREPPAGCTAKCRYYLCSHVAVSKTQLWVLTIHHGCFWFRMRGNNHGIWIYFSLILKDYPKQQTSIWDHCQLQWLMVHVWIVWYQFTRRSKLHQASTKDCEEQAVHGPRLQWLASGRFGGGQS